MGTMLSAARCTPIIVQCVGYIARNNLISTVDVTWRESLENEKQWSTNLLKAKKEEETAQIASHYTKSV